MRRDANTMPQWAGSCWYYLRFCDPRNTQAAWSPEAERYWMPVDLYVGGAEHAVLHLLYARFWHKVLYDLGLVHTKEPFQKLLNPGMVLGYSYRYYDDNLSDDPAAPPRCHRELRGAHRGRALRPRRDRRRAQGALAARGGGALGRRSGRPLHPQIEGLVLEQVTEKMSKSRGNVVNPDDVIARWGCDSMRLYEMFMGPLDKGAPWSDESIPGLYRFLQRAWRLVEADAEGGGALVPGDGTPEQQRLLARTVKGVTEDVEAMRFNTAISKLMVFVRDVGSPVRTTAAAELRAAARALRPAPGRGAVAAARRRRPRSPTSRGREADAALLVADTVTLVGRR